MIKAMKILNHVKSIEGTNAKIDYLRKYKDVDKDLSVILLSVYSPYMVFGISEKKYKRALGMLDNPFLEESVKRQHHYTKFIDVLKYLEEYNTGADYDLKVLATYINGVPRKDVLQFVHEVVTKKLRIGMNAKSINKAYGEDFIPEFKVQLAHKYDAQRVGGRAFAITEKIDGQRCYAVKENGKITFYARSGKVIPGLVDLQRQLYKHKGDVVLDGELVYNGQEKLSTNERYSKTMSILSATGNKENISFKMFDVVSIESFKKGITYNYRYKDRRVILESKIETFGMDKTLMQVLPVLYTGTDVTKVNEYLMDITGKGGEGVMVNILDSPYEFKRTYNLMKVKPDHDCDLVVCGYKEGDGKYTGQLGALICEYKNNMVDVGSGLSDKQRITFWRRRKQLIGKIVKVKYFEETITNGKYSLRFPRFIEIRKDKTEPSYE